MPEMVNREALEWLLADDACGFPPAPPWVLTDWVATVPDDRRRSEAERALKKRFGVEPAPATQDLKMHAAWLEAPFRPPVYTTSDETGERRLLSHEIVVKAGMLETGPRKMYRMPSGISRADIRKWLAGEPPYDDRESYAVWTDWEDQEYEMVDGRLQPSLKAS